MQGLAVRIARAVALLATLIVLARSADANNVDTLIRQLSDSSDKVRLAAAVNLAKLGDEKAILALAKALLNDSDKNVRSACAVALGKLVGPSTKASVKNLAVNNLKTAVARDASDFVKQQAQQALDTITGGGTKPGTGDGRGPPGKGGIYVNIGPMSSKTGASDDKWRSLMVKTAEKTMQKKATGMQLSWPGGPPTKAGLAKAGAAGFYIDGTLNELKVTTSGGGATISCKVSMLLADFPDKSVFGFLNGGASVTASSSKKDQDLASEDCIVAVIENLIANKIVPTIKAKVP
jgi:hypothetical protein